MALKTIGTLWIGGSLTWLEQLCLKSFLDHGHEVVLFTYGEVKGIPAGVRVEDANTILPTETIIRHAKTGSPAYHADVFRLHMLVKTDYVWADTDAFCCQPWKFKGKHFHGWISDDTPSVNNGVLSLPKSSKTLAAMLKFTSDEYPIPPWYKREKQDRLRAEKARGEGTHVSLLPWGVWGPDALTWFLTDTGEIEKSQPGHVIYPIPFKLAGLPLNASRVEKARSFIREDTLSIHFWGRRFRNIAAKFGGLPPAGCYVEELLKKHEIDPRETSELLVQKSQSSAKPSSSKKGQANAAKWAGLDFSMFDDADLVNVILQRPEIASDASHLIKDYAGGDDKPLLKYARENRERVLQDGVAIAERECELFGSATDKIQPKSILDIGCGYAFASLLLHRKHGSDITLVDIETSSDDSSKGERYFGYNKDHPGYTSLEKAKKFLVNNGVPAKKIKTVNPKDDDVNALGGFDLVFSLASCGFHYPINTYETVFKKQINDGGGIVLDIRKGSGGIRTMKDFGTIDIVAKHAKYSTVVSYKDAVK